MKYAFIFPGQGSQTQGMGRDFYQSFASAKMLFEEASDALQKDMVKLLFEENNELHQTQWTQPAIFLVSFVAHRIFEDEFSLSPALALGHSLGELSAVSIAGGLSFENAMKLTHLRGKLMARACEGKDAGMMVVIGLEDGVLESFTQERRDSGEEIWCANYNGDGQVVLAGKRQDLQNNETRLKELGAKRALMLPMSVASHCPMLEGMRSEFEGLLEEMLNKQLMMPIIANANLESYTSKAQAKELLSLQLVSPVLYKQSIRSLEGQVDGFVEFGHGNILKGLNKRLSSKPTLSIGDIQSLRESITILNQGAE